MQLAEATLTRKQVKDIFKNPDNRGEQQKLADALGVSHVAVSRVLRGHNKSHRILKAARARALELLEQEASQ